MTRTARPPQTLREAVHYFSDEWRCLAFAASLRWPDGVSCPACGTREVTFLPTRRVWKCRNTHPRQQFSVKVGTLFEDSPIGLEKWFVAIWMVANQPEGVTTYEVAAQLGVTPKSAAYMLDRMRRALEARGLDAIEDDELIKFPVLPSVCEGGSR